MTRSPINSLVIATMAEGQIKISWENPQIDYEYARIYVSEIKGEMGTLGADNVLSSPYFYQGEPETHYWITVKGVSNGVESVSDKQMYIATWKSIPKIGSFATLHQQRLWTILGTLTKYSDDYGITETTMTNNLPSGNYYPFVTNNGTILVFKGKIGYWSMNGSSFTSIVFKDKQDNLVSLIDGMNFIEWSFAEDNDGVFYLIPYGNVKDEFDVYVNLMWWYKSVDGGKTFVQQDNLKSTDNKHFHQIKVNPYTNTLYITTGDANKRLFKSTDKGETWTEVIPTSYPQKTSANINYAGHTGVGFLSDGTILWGTDWQPKDENGVYANWFVRSNGDDVNSFVYDKIPRWYYGMSKDIIVDGNTDYAYNLLDDEFKENDVTTALAVTQNKGITWKPILANAPDAISTDTKPVYLIKAVNNFNDTPYIFVALMYGNGTTVRISKPPEGETGEDPEEQTLLLSPTSIMVKMSQRITLTPVLLGVVDSEIEYRVSDNTVLSVNSKGEVTPLKTGITCVQAVYGGLKSNKVWVTVMSDNSQMAHGFKTKINTNEEIIIPLFVSEQTSKLKIKTQNGVVSFKLIDSDPKTPSIRVMTAYGIKTIKGFE